MISFCYSFFLRKNFGKALPETQNVTKQAKITTPIYWVSWKFETQKIK